MAKKELKELLYANPNEFWRLVGQLGIGNADVSAVLQEAEKEMDGSGVEEFEAAFLQGLVLLTGSG